MEVTNQEQNKRQEVLNALPHFTGTENYYEHRMFGGGRLLLTDGVKYISEEAGAFWLIDAIASYQRKLRSYTGMQVWTLQRKNDCEFFLECTDGNSNRLVYQKIPFSDFCLNSITYWLCEGVLMLKSEY